MKLRIFLLTLFAAIAIPVLSQNSDISVLRNINHPHNPGLDNSMKVVSGSVMPMSIAFPVGVITYDLIRGRKLFRRDFVIAGAVGGSVAICLGLKYVVNRPRPFVTYSDIIQRDFHVGPYSFPSGHTSTAFSLATSASLCFPKWYIIAPSFLWAGTVAYSRMRLGVHYPTDVIAGAVVGSGCAILSWYITGWIYSKYFTPKSHPDSDPLPGFSATAR